MDNATIDATIPLICLDFSATTPMDERVVAKTAPFLTQQLGNPASRSHAYSWRAEEAVEAARAEVAALVNADPKEIVWTSGATESDNLAIKGTARFYAHKDKHLVTCETEHKAVLDSFCELEREGFEATYLDPQLDGLLDLSQFEQALRPDTILASIMHVNNEIGVAQDIAAIGTLCRQYGVLLHVDAAQSTGKVDIDLRQMPVDLMSVSGHKSYGLKGIGALYVRRKPRVRIEPQIHGGGHERGIRSGTQPVHQIVGMGTAFRIAREEMAGEATRIRQLRDRLLRGLNEIDEVHVNGGLDQCVAHILNVSSAFVAGESLMMAIRDLAVSSGSACTSASLEPSHVLRAIGRPDKLAHSSIRFSLGRTTTEAGIGGTVTLVKSAVARLRMLSPLWDMHQEGVDPASVQWAVH